MEYVFLTIYMVAFTFICTYTCMQVLVYFSYKRYRPTPTVEIDEYPMVTIQLPIYNEKYVILNLLNAVTSLIYPADKLEIQILDDSNDETSTLIDSFLTEHTIPFSVNLIRRKNRSGYKAGALAQGLKVAKGNYIAIFDADFEPKKDFLLLAMPHFSGSKNDKIGVIQTRWGHMNESQSFLTRLQAFHLNVHFFIEQTGRYMANVFLQFNGTAGIWRKECIVEAGGWSDETLTEDLDLSYRAQLKGWHISYHPEIACPAELPSNMNNFKAQQYRWMKGGAETAKKIIPRLFAVPLNASTRFHAILHLMNSSIFLANILAVGASIGLYFTLTTDLFNHFLFAFPLAYMVLIIIYYEANVKSTRHSEDFRSNPTTSIWSFLILFPIFLVLSMGMSLCNTKAVLHGYLGLKTQFVRTPKFNARSAKRSLILQNNYTDHKLPPMTVMEILLGVILIGLCIHGIWNEKYEFVVFHGMMGLGTFLIGMYSIIELYFLRRCK